MHTFSHLQSTEQHVFKWTEIDTIDRSKLTLSFSTSFLKEVSDSNAVNQMDSSNLGIVFSPTVFRSDQSDIMKVLAEAKTAQVNTTPSSLIIDALCNFTDFFVLNS